MAQSAAKRNADIAAAKLRLLKHIRDDQDLIEAAQERQRQNVARARQLQVYWSDIARATGLTSKQAAFDRFGAVEKQRQRQALDEMDALSLFDV